MKAKQRQFIVLLIGWFFILTPAYVGIAFYIYDSVPNTAPPNLSNISNNINSFSNEIKLSLMIISISIAFLSSVAMHYLRNFFGNRNSNFTDVYYSNIAFSRKRRDEIKNLKKGDIYDIYCTSHCNLFSDVCDTDDEREKLKAINTEFFKYLATLTKNSSACINLLIYYEDDNQLYEELYERIKIMNDSNETWGKDSFSVKALRYKGLQDYLVIGNMVFSTIRKTDKSPGGTKFTFAKGHNIATVYRDWLKDIFQNGTEGRYLVDFDKGEKLNKLIEEIKENPDDFANR